MGDWLGPWEWAVRPGRGEAPAGGGAVWPAPADLTWKYGGSPGDYGVAKKGDLSVFLTAERHPRKP